MKPFSGHSPASSLGPLAEAAELACTAIAPAAAFAPRRSLLHLNCGAGHLLAAMRADGWRVQGVDELPASCAEARTRHQLPVHRGSLDEWLSAPLCRPFPFVIWLGHLAPQKDRGTWLQALHAATEPHGVVLLRRPAGGDPTDLGAAGFEVLQEYEADMPPAVMRLAGGGEGVIDPAAGAAGSRTADPESRGVAMLASLRSRLRWLLAPASNPDDTCQPDRLAIGAPARYSPGQGGHVAGLVIVRRRH